MRKTFGAGLNKEEAEKVECLFNYDELWDYLQGQGVEDDRIQRLQDRLNRVINQAVKEEMI